MEFNGCKMGRVMGVKRGRVIREVYGEKRRGFLVGKGEGYGG